MVFHLARPRPGPGQAWSRPRPGQRPSKKLENWKNTIKIGKYWKLLDYIGKLKVFQYFSSKKLEKLLFFMVFHLARPRQAPDSPIYLS